MPRQFGISHPGEVVGGLVEGDIEIDPGALVLGQHHPGPEHVDAAVPAAAEALRFLFEHRHPPALHAEHVEELVPETLRLGTLAGFVRPFPGERAGAILDFVETQRHPFPPLARRIRHRNAVSVAAMGEQRGAIPACAGMSGKRTEMTGKRESCTALVCARTPLDQGCTAQIQSCTELPARVHGTLSLVRATISGMHAAFSRVHATNSVVHGAFSVVHATLQISRAKKSGPAGPDPCHIPLVSPVLPCRQARVRPPCRCCRPGRWRRAGACSWLRS